MLDKETTRIISFVVLFLPVICCCSEIISTSVAQEKAPDAATKIGPSGLLIPRFVSLKADKVNVRQGPSTDHRVAWVFRRIGLPVEIIAEFEHWRHVRDSEGQEGWVYHSLLSGRRTALVTPWMAGKTSNGGNGTDSAPIRANPSLTANVIANIEPGVLVNISSCDGQWCEFSLKDFNGWIEQENLWGVYKGEEVN